MARGTAQIPSLERQSDGDLVMHFDPPACDDCPAPRIVTDADAFAAEGSGDVDAERCEACGRPRPVFVQVTESGCVFMHRVGPA